MISSEFSKIRNGKKYKNIRSKAQMADKLSVALNIDVEELLEEL